MPFASQAQRRLMYARHPDIAERWRKESGPQRGLPERSSKKRKKGRGRRQQMIRDFVKEQRHG